MKQNIKLKYGVLSIAPIAIWLLFMVTSPFIEQDTQPKGLFTVGDLYPGAFGKLTVFAILVGIFFALFLAIKVLRNNYVPKEKKFLWVFLLVFGNIIVLPFFWAFYFRKSNVAG